MKEFNSWELYQQHEQESCGFLKAELSENLRDYSIVSCSSHVESEQW